MSLQIYIIFFFLCNTKGDVLKNVHAVLFNTIVKWMGIDNVRPHIQNQVIYRPKFMLSFTENISTSFALLHIQTRRNANTSKPIMLALICIQLGVKRPTWSHGKCNYFTRWRFGMNSYDVNRTTTYDFYNKAHEGPLLTPPLNNRRWGHVLILQS